MASSLSSECSALLEVFRQRETLLIQLGKILDVNMKFDSLKMTAPSIPNDISYVKRQATLRRKDNQMTTVEPDQLGELSMFYIEHNPAMKSVIKTITEFFQSAESKSESLDLIVVFCKVKGRKNRIHPMLNCKLNSTNGGTFSNSAEKII